MLYRFLAIVVIASFIVGCGGGSSDNSTSDSPSSTASNSRDEESNNIQEKVVDNLGVVIQKEFESYKIVVLCNKKLSEAEEISQGTKALYGKINNKPTNALLKMNSHYKNMNIVVKVYQKSNLVGVKQLSMRDESSVDFGNIIIK